MSAKFHLTCILAIIIMATAIPVNKTTTTNTTVNIELNHLPDYLEQDLPQILLFIFVDTYAIMSNTIVIVPGCTQTATANTQSDIIQSLLQKTNSVGEFSLEIQSDFTVYDTASQTFLWFIDSGEAFR